MFRARLRRIPACATAVSVWWVREEKSIEKSIDTPTSYIFPSTRGFFSSFFAALTHTHERARFFLLLSNAEREHHLGLKKPSSGCSMFEKVVCKLYKQQQRTSHNWIGFLRFAPSTSSTTTPRLTEKSTPNTAKGDGIKSNDVHWCLNSFHNVFIYYIYVYHLTLSLPA